MKYKRKDDFYCSLNYLINEREESWFEGFATGVFTTSFVVIFILMLFLWVTF